MQWAGVPDSVYNRTEGKNDYTDDYASRGAWVNWLAGGSPVLPKDEGLNIPVDMAFAFHTDCRDFLGRYHSRNTRIYMTHFNRRVIRKRKIEMGLARSLRNGDGRDRQRYTTRIRGHGHAAISGTVLCRSAYA